MRICKFKKALLTSAILMWSSLSLFLFGQSLDMPSMPEMPSMPSIGEDFYTPSFPTRPNKSNLKKTTTEPGKDKNETVLTEAITPDSVLTSNLTKGNILTAYDISSLYDSGLFSNLSSLDTTSSMSNYNTSSSTNVLLQQVLNGLNDLKKQQQNASPKEKNELNATKVDSENFKKREPSILRFKINGYNIADSLTKVFFSDTEPDGSFLLTGDRRYFVNQQARTETFYMLFKTSGSNGSTLTYRVQPTIVQDYKNENSYVYKLSGVKNLTAEKTGNLVVIHYSGDSVNADLLLDIDSK